MLHDNTTLVDRVDLATPLSLSSQPATGLSALAPAQRAGAQRLRAVALCDSLRGAETCPKSELDRKSPADTKSRPVIPERTFWDISAQEDADRHWLGERPTNFLNARLNAASDS